MYKDFINRTNYSFLIHVLNCSRGGETFVAKIVQRRALSEHTSSPPTPWSGWTTYFTFAICSSLSAVNPTALQFVRSTASVVGLDLRFQPLLCCPAVSGEY